MSFNVRIPPRDTLTPSPFIVKIIPPPLCLCLPVHVQLDQLSVVRFATFEFYAFRVEAAKMHPIDEAKSCTHATILLPCIVFPYDLRLFQQAINLYIKDCSSPA